MSDDSTINCPHCGESIDHLREVMAAERERDNWPPRFVRSEHFGEWPEPERCDYGSCGSTQAHLGPHRCGACSRPCDDPEVTCEVHRAGWAKNPERVELEAKKIADWSSSLNARLAPGD